MPILLILSQAMVGKNCLQSKCVGTTRRITISKLVSFDSTTSMAHLAHTRVEKKRPRLRSLGKSPLHKMAAKLKFGETDNKLDPSCTWTIAWKDCDG